MPKNSDLTESERYQIIGFHKAGFSRNNINKMLGFPKTSQTQKVLYWRSGPKFMPRRIEACIANNGWPTNIKHVINSQKVTQQHIKSLE